MSLDEQRLLESCIGVLTDMIDNQILQFFLTHEIVVRKFPSLAGDLGRRAQAGQYSFGYTAFLATVRNELYDLNLDECFFAFTSRPAKMSIEESDAYDTCLRTNKIVLGTLMPSGDCAALSQLAFYVLDQGLRAKIAQEMFVANQNDADE